MTLEEVKMGCNKLQDRRNTIFREHQELLKKKEMEDLKKLQELEEKKEKLKEVGIQTEEEYVPPTVIPEMETVKLKKVENIETVNCYFLRFCIRNCICWKFAKNIHVLLSSEEYQGIT